jgi:hypothetical protein
VGAAWIFIKKSDNSWIQQRKLVATAVPAYTSVGSSVSISNDGNTVLIGAPSDPSNIGGSFVFRRTGTSWSQIQKCVGAPHISTYPLEGGAVALAADGRAFVIGASAENSNIGATYLFTQSTESAWSQQGSKYIGNGSVGTAIYQSYSLAISSDGATIIVSNTHNN